MNRSFLLQSGRLFLALAIVFFLVKQFVDLLDDLEVKSVSFQPFWLIASLGLLIGYRTLLVYPWRTLYRSAKRYRQFSGLWQYNTSVERASVGTRIE